MTLVAFHAEKAENAARLSWKTTHEPNASHFEVEKSSDGHNFGMIGRIEAADNSIKIQNIHLMTAHLQIMLT